MRSARWLRGASWSRQVLRGQRRARRAVRAMSDLVDHSWSTAAALGHGIVEGTAFGSNPGNLRMLVHAPLRGPAAGAPLILLLHGCGQHAGSFAAQSGWIALADRLGIPLVLPEQKHANNRGGCFNWFQPGDVRRGRGEILSLRQMARAAAARFGSDPARIFVAGLSAGGAMTTALLAAYPDAFAAGAVFAGVPAGAATSAAQALRCMAQAPFRPDPEFWLAHARGLAPARYRGRWPRLSIWQGEADRVVHPANAACLAAQWRALRGEDGVELRLIAGMGHGVPIDAAVAGRPGPFVLDVGIDAPGEVAGFWGL